MRTSGYTSRVGELALGLGIGAAVVAGFGCGAASAEPGGQSTPPPSDSTSQSTTTAPGGTSATTNSTETGTNQTRPSMGAGTSGKAENDRSPASTNPDSTISEQTGSVAVSESKAAEESDDKTDADEAPTGLTDPGRRSRSHRPTTANTTAPTDRTTTPSSTDTARQEGAAEFSGGSVTATGDEIAEELNTSIAGVPPVSTATIQSFAKVDQIMAPADADIATPTWNPAEEVHVTGIVSSLVQTVLNPFATTTTPQAQCPHRQRCGRWWPSCAER